MSTATLELDRVAETEETLQYRALHIGAVLGVVLGLLSIFTLVAAVNSLEGTLLVAPIPLLGMFISLYSLGRIRREPEQYTGRGLAWTGLVLSAGFLLGGVGYGGYVYATEVPDGYTRIAFTGMKPSPLHERNGVAVPPEIAALDGQRVFIKGYIRPDSVKVTRGIDRFLLVRDNNQCCFGDIASVKYYDQVLVEMVGSRRVDYSQRVFRMAGILKVEPQNVRFGHTAPVFSLKADYVK